MWSIGFMVFVAFFLLVAFRSRSAAGDTCRGNSHTRESCRYQARAHLARQTTLDRACRLCLRSAARRHQSPDSDDVAAILCCVSARCCVLSLYLLSFILCFDSDRWYRRWLFTRLAVVELAAMVYLMADSGNFSNLKVAVALFSSALFVFFMVCHGELARRRPSSRYLTSFYLMVSVGGALGGLLVGFVFPYVLPALIDLPIILSRLLRSCLHTCYGAITVLSPAPK